MPIMLERHADPERYRVATAAYLDEHFAPLNQLYTMLHGLTPALQAQRQSWLIRLQDEGQTCGMAMIHSPLPVRTLSISSIDAEAVGLLAAALAADGILLDDLIGPQQAAASLAAAIAPRQNVRARARLGNHVLDAAPVIPASPGYWRAAREDDLPLLMSWERAFQVECGLPAMGDGLDAMLRQRLGAANTHYRIWECDGVPAAMAVGRMAGRAGRISPVYTAPSMRGQGHAGALVGQLCRDMLAGGCQAIFLFTDLDNPTSNGVYARIGFRCMEELAHLHFSKD